MSTYIYIHIHMYGVVGAGAHPAGYANDDCAARFGPSPASGPAFVPGVILNGRIV